MNFDSWSSAFADRGLRTVLGPEADTKSRFKKSSTSFCGILKFKEINIYSLSHAESLT